MSLFKTGVASKIRTVVSNEKDFEALKGEIISQNSLVRCQKCGKLLAKADNNNTVSIKRKDIDLIAKVEKLSIKCPVCSTPNQVIL